MRLQRATLPYYTDRKDVENVKTVMVLLVPYQPISPNIDCFPRNNLLQI